MASFDINNVGVEMEYAEDVFSQHQMKSMSESLFVHFRAASMMLLYVAGCYATLWDVTLRCWMLRYVFHLSSDDKLNSLQPMNISFFFLLRFSSLSS